MARITIKYINTLSDKVALQDAYESIIVDAYSMFQGARNREAIWNRASFLSLEKRYEALKARMTELGISDMDGQVVSDYNFGDIIA